MTDQYGNEYELRSSDDPFYYFDDIYNFDFDYDDWRLHHQLKKEERESNEQGRN